MKTHGLVPMLETANLRQTVAFYTEFLGFECRGQYPNEENPCWVNLWNRDTEIAFSQPNEHQDFNDSRLTGSIYLYVENIDDVWQELKERVEIVYPLEDMDYGMREFGIKDCNGYVLNLGQDISAK
jgi:uncharacterized glyoxalase superfamily protein PhnB